MQLPSVAHTTASPLPSGSTPTRRGTVAVSLELPLAARQVWHLLTEPSALACWFGRLRRPFAPGLRTRLEFGDGDFFQIDVRRVEAPSLLVYTWRFLGISPPALITWQVLPTPHGTRVTVQDAAAQRMPAAAQVLHEGWLDFTDRLYQHGVSGISARYDWRHAVDAELVLPGSLDRARSILYSAEARPHWLPWQGDNLEPHTICCLGDGKLPTRLEISHVEWTSPTQVELCLGSHTWLHPTHCRLELTPYGEHALLGVSHTGWERISPDEAEQRRQRMRFCQLWVGGLRRARRLLT